MSYGTARCALFAGLILAIAGPALSQAPSADSKPPAAAKSASADQVQNLIAQLGHDKFRVRERASQDLIAVGRRAVPALHEATNSLDAEIRMRAHRILAAIEISMPYLLEGLRDTNPQVRKEAALSLERLGPTAKEALPVLLQVLKDADEAVREAAASAILTIDPENQLAADVVPQRAHINNKYARLVRRLKAPDDYRTYSEFREYGFYQQCSWAGHLNVPAGYWVYVYPYWYIWGDRLREQ